MKTENLDTILAGIRSDAADVNVADAAASRVRARLFAAQAGATATAGAGSLRTCADFQALIPAYLNRSLAPARSLLLVDHTHTCVECRKSLETARSGNVRELRRPQAVSTAVSPLTKWAIAAMLAVGVGAGTWTMLRSMLVEPGSRATVQSVTGILYEVADASGKPVFAGHELGDRQVVRSAKGAGAVLRLTDGSLVELNERSQVSITRASRGTTINLDRGGVIVQAAKQHNGALYVHTADCEVMVKGTIFAVSRGTKGSRVSVVEGSVKVDQGPQSQMLKPGDQVTTDASVEKIPIQNEIAWSQNSAKYLAVLGELSGLQKDLERIPAAGLRTSSKLLDLVPANTVLYAAMPNIGGSLGEANRLFQDRIRSSPVLTQWWEENQQGAAQLQQLVQKMQTASSYLGDEIVLAIANDVDGKMAAPMILAEQKRPGLKEFLQSEMANSNAASQLELFESPADLRAAGSNRRTAKVLLSKSVVAFSPEAATLRDLAGRVTEPDASPGFTGRAFHTRIQQAYDAGAGWLFCADLGQMTRGMGQRAGRAAMDATGLSGVRFLVVERKDVNGLTKNQATLGFDGSRRGMAAWLAAPGPMSTLDFISPDASAAASFVIQNPGALISQFLSQLEAEHPEAQQKIDDFQRQTGVQIVHDLADPLGGELTLAIDGPLMPVPSWKLAVEVYSPDRLQWAFERLVTAFNQQPDAPTKLDLSKTQEGGRTFYTLKAVGGQAGQIPAEVDYVFVDSYLLAAANRGLLTAAIQNRSTGYTLPRSEKFRAQLPKDANSNFSALVYHNVGGAVATLVDGLKTMKAINPQQKQAIETLQANSAPGLIYAYGEPDRIVLSANGSLFGFSLDSFALPKVIENAMRLKQR